MILKDLACTFLHMEDLRMSRKPNSEKHEERRMAAALFL